MIFQNVQNLSFFGKKMGYSEKGPWKVSRSLTVTNFSRKCLNRYCCLGILKTFVFCFFSEKKWVFSIKNLGMFQDRWLWKCFQNAYKTVLLLGIFQNVQNLSFFWGKNGLFRKMPWNVSISLIVTNLSKNVSNGTFD